MERSRVPEHLWERAGGSGDLDREPGAALPKKAGMILEHARIWTGNPRQPWAEAMRIQEGRIAAVGSRSEVEGPGPRRDLQGRLVIPGLWDAHIHLYDWALARQQVCLAGCRTREELLERVRRHALATPRGWVVGWGWNAGDWDDPRLPDRRELDAISERPMLLVRSDMHSGLANTAALREVGYLQVPEIPGGRIDTREGDPTGLILELAMNPLRKASAPAGGAELEAALEEGLQQLHRWGVTAVCDQRMKDGAEGPPCRAALAKLFREGRLRTRVRTNVAVHELPLEPGPEFRTEFLRLGHGKIFSDGALGSRTARLLEPFEHDGDNRGMWATPPEELARDFRRVVEAGFPVSVHAIGDEAVRVCLDLLEALPRLPGAPHRVEHVQIATREDLARLAPAGLVASVQPGHCLDDMDLGDTWLGARARRLYRFRTLHEHGTLLAFGSDAPVSDPDPFYGLHAAVHRSRPGQAAWHPEERLDLETALRAYTSGAARAAGCEAVTGSLEVGKLADLAVLDRDLFETEHYLGTRSVLTLVGGEIVHEA